MFKREIRINIPRGNRKGKKISRDVRVSMKITQEEERELADGKGYHNNKGESEIND